MTERQQLAMALEESRRAAVADDDSSDEEMLAPKRSSSSSSSSSSGGAAGREDSDDDDDDDDDVLQQEGRDDDEEDGEDEDDDAPGMLMDKSESRRWWEGSAGFDFQKSRTDKNKTDGMLVKGDPDGYVGKIVLRYFGRGVQSYGKVVGWFPEEEVGDGVLYHVLHGDGDEEDLDKVECRTAIREAEQEPDSDSDLDGSDDGGAKAYGSREAAANLVVGQEGAGSGAAKAARAAELKAQARERAEAMNQMLRRTPKYSAAPKDSTEAALRGVHFIFSLSKDHNAMANFGSDLAQTLYDIGAVAPDPIRKDALQRVESVSQAWKNRFTSMKTLTEDGDTKKVSAEEVTHAIMGLYSLERVGEEHPLKQETAAIVQKKKFSKKDFLGFDVDRPNVLTGSTHHDERFSTFTAGINTAYYVAKVGIDVGFNLPEVLAHVRTLRPYHLPGHKSLGDGNEGWIDQITMVFNIVHVFSNFGELRLRPAVLPHECAFLRRAANMDKALAIHDVHVVGELCHCLRIFGHDPYTCAPLREGVAFLLEMQNVKDGSWPTRGGESDAYTRYHAAMCATMALYEPVFRGFGPGSVELRQLSEKWKRKDKREGKTTGLEDVFEAEDENGGEGVGGSDGTGADGLAVPPGALSAVEEAYTGQPEYSLEMLNGGAGDGGEDGAGGAAEAPKAAIQYKEPKTLEEHAEARLISLLRWKETMAHASLDDFRSGGGGGGGGGGAAGAGGALGKLKTSNKARSMGQSRVSKAKIRASQLRSSAEQIPEDPEAFQEQLLRHWASSPSSTTTASSEKEDANPSINGHAVNLHLLFKKLAARGGFSALHSSDNEWAKIVGAMRLPTSAVTPKALRELYKQKLHSFEIYFIESCVKSKRQQRLDELKKQRAENSNFTSSSSYSSLKGLSLKEIALQQLNDKGAFGKKKGVPKKRAKVSDDDDDDEEEEWNEDTAAKDEDYSSPDGDDVDDLI
jgi:hypothetical protein